MTNNNELILDIRKNYKRYELRSKFDDEFMTIDIFKSSGLISCIDTNDFKTTKYYYVNFENRENENILNSLKNISSINKSWPSAYLLNDFFNSKDYDYKDIKNKDWRSVLQLINGIKIVKIV